MPEVFSSFGSTATADAANDDDDGDDGNEVRDDFGDDIDDNDDDDSDDDEPSTPSLTFIPNLTTNDHSIRTQLQLSLYEMGNLCVGWSGCIGGDCCSGAFGSCATVTAPTKLAANNHNRNMAFPGNIGISLCFYSVVLACSGLVPRAGSVGVFEYLNRSHTKNKGTILPRLFPVMSHTHHSHVTRGRFVQKPREIEGYCREGSWCCVG